MILLNTKTGIKTKTNNISLVARTIGVHRSTIHRWKNDWLKGKPGGEKQIYNNFILEF